jgi:NADH:ubiquinone oxidoreductase subunit F (NADH-binding)
MTTPDAHADAVQRLEAALVEQDRLGELYRAAIGTSKEFGAYVRLRGASDQVAGREAWLQSLDGGNGRVWINGREVGGAGSLFQGLEDSHE